MPDNVQLPAQELDRMVDEGVLSAAQRDEILQRRAAIAPAAGGFSLTTIAYYFGGFVVLLTYLSFSAPVLILGGAAPLLWGLVTMAVTGIPGFYLWRNTRFQLGGQMLLLIAASLVPYCVFAFFGSAGLLHAGDSYEEFIEDVQPAFLAALFLSSAIVVAAIAWTRAPFLTAVLAALLLLLIFDIASWAGAQVGANGYAEGLVMVALAVPLGMCTIVLERSERENYAFWLALAALVAVTAGVLTIGVASSVEKDDHLAFMLASVLAGASWMFVALYTQFNTDRGTENVFYVGGALITLVVLAIPCFLTSTNVDDVVYLLGNVAVIACGVYAQRRVPSIIGAIGAFMYLSIESRLLFGASALWFMTFIGIAIIAGAIAWDRTRDRPAIESVPPRS